VFVQKYAASGETAKDSPSGRRTPGAVTRQGGMDGAELKAGVSGVEKNEHTQAANKIGQGRQPPSVGKMPPSKIRERKDVKGYIDEFNHGSKNLPHDED